MSDPARVLWRYWQQGLGPDLGDFLAGAGELTPDQLLAVVRVDQQQRWEGGERVPAEDYFRRFPTLAASPEGSVLLVYGEFLLRKRLGQAPAPEEYLARFPQYAGQLRLQFELHRALQEGGSSSGASQAADSGPPDLPGYELLGELGRGATGVVYRARRADGVLVAVKVLRGDVRLGDRERARFRTEAETLARLSHPNVVRILEIGEWSGRPWMALEFVAGGSLARRLDTGTVSVAEAVAVVETLARAVQHVHEHGVLHRDLNPANVLLSPDGTPKITDFGLARCDAQPASADRDPTRSGTVLGTPCCMAPEQADGRPRDIGPATDVYALGAILYHLLTGRPPYDEGSVVPTLLRIRSAVPPEPVRLRRPEVSDALERVCLRCLAKRPEDRYPTALALAEALAPFVAARPAAEVEQPGVYLLASATGERFRLDNAEVVLGRAADCDIRVQAREVSRRHCRIVRASDPIVVEDLGSTWGTRVNGRRIDRATLGDGDLLEVGGQTFLVRVVGTGCG